MLVFSTTRVFLRRNTRSGKTLQCKPILLQPINSDNQWMNPSSPSPKPTNPLQDPAAQIPPIVLDAVVSKFLPCPLLLFCGPISVQFSCEPKPLSQALRTLRTAHLFAHGTLRSAQRPGLLVGAAGLPLNQIVAAEDSQEASE